MKKSILLLWILSYLSLNGSVNEKINQEYKSNFYKAINKEWIIAHPIPDDKMGVDNFTLINDKITIELKKIITSLKTKKELTKDEETIFNLYSSYTDIKDRDTKGIAPLQDELQMINAASSHEDIAILFAKFQKISIDSPFLLSISADKKNSNTNIVYVSQNGISLSKDYYKKDSENSKKEVKLLEEFYSNLLSLGKFKESKKKAQSVMDIESKLAEIQWSNIQNRDEEKSYNIVDFDAFNKSLSSLSITKYLKILGIPKDTKFNINQPSYLSNFNKLFTEIEIDRWKDYLRVKLLMNFRSYLTTDYSSAFATYKRKRGLASKEPPLETRAIYFIDISARMLFGKLYIENNFDKNAKIKVKKLVKNIINEYEIAINNSQRLSEPTKVKALEKLHKMKFNIGYPDKWRDFSSLKILKNDLVYNIKQIALFEHHANIGKLSKPVDKEEWDESPQTVNASYLPTQNKFILFAGILNKPLFTKNGSDAEAYGGIGFIIGHEIGHAFDDQGGNYDADGNLNNWWAKEDYEKFNTLKEKLITQVNSYEILPNKFENGKLKIGEFIADLSGAEIVLRAYLKVAISKGVTKDKALKLFFSQLAKTWRSTYRVQFLNMLIDEDPHPASEFRVNGTLKNMDMFYEAYGITKGDFMYLEPAKRVKIW